MAGGEWTDVGKMERNKERFNEFVDYWKEVARNVKAIGHTDAENHVVRYAQMQMFEDLATDARSPILGIETPSKEYVGHMEGDDLLAEWDGAIVIAEEVEKGSSKDRDAVIDRCHHIWDLCMAKVRKDQRTGRIYKFNFNTKAVPVREIFRNMAGVRVPVRMLAQFSLAMNPEDYLNEDIDGPAIPYAKVDDQGEEILLGPNGMHTCTVLPIQYTTLTDASQFPFVYIGRAVEGTAQDAAGWTVTRQEILPDTTSVVLVAEGIEWTNRNNVNNWN